MSAPDSQRSPSQVVAFSGHRTDEPGRRPARFPDSKVERVRRAVGGWIARQPGRVHAVCSAARGADLIFLGEVLARQGTATVVLPFPVPELKQVSGGPGWDEQLDTVLSSSRVEVKPPLLQSLPPAAAREQAFVRCNQAIIAEAERLARLRAGRAPILLTVWDGRAGDGPGGTGSMVAEWTHRGHAHQNLDIRQL